MLRSVVLFAILLLSRAISFAQSPDELPVLPSVIAGEFSTPDQYSLAALSPDGSRLAMMEWQDGARIVVFDVTTPNHKTLIIQTTVRVRDQPVGHDKYQYLHWLTDSKLLISVVEPYLLSSTGEIYYPRQFYLFDLAEKKLTRPFQAKFPNKIRGHLFDQASVVSWPTKEDEPLLLSLHNADSSTYYRPEVFAVNSDTFEISRVQKSKRFISGWMVDLTGTVRIGFERRYRSGKREVIFRLAGETRWRKLSAASSKPGVTFSILSFSNDPNQVYVASNFEQEPAALYLYDLEEKEFGEKLAEHDRYEISSIMLSIDNDLSAVFAGDVVVYTADDEHKLISRLAEDLDIERYSLQAESRDGDRRIYYVSSSDSHGAYYLADDSDETFDKLVDIASPEADKASFGQTWSGSFMARDGLELDTYIALPAGFTPETTERLPFVVMPHGGPWARDFADFDPLTQYINSLGIGVLKVNFRGSYGYGSEFEELGVGQWGRAMQEDINDALAWGIGENWIDADRVCIVGWSFGGYASLMASIEDADKYQCAASIAGVADLVNLVRETNDKELLRRIGVKNKFDGKSVREFSPMHRASDVGIPIFLAHGTSDTVVNVYAHYATMLNALKENGNTVDSVVFLNGNHSLTSPTDREILYQRLGIFLENHLLE